MESTTRKDGTEPYLRPRRSDRPNRIGRIEPATNAGHQAPESTPRHIRKEARLARTLAARATTPTHETLTVTAGDIRPGDFLEQIPTQHQVRGVSANATVADVAPDYTWRIGKIPVPAVRFTFAVAAAEPMTPTVSVPASFTCTIRRPVTP